MYVCVSISFLSFWRPPNWSVSGGKIFVNIYCVNLMKCIESSSNKWALCFSGCTSLFDNYHQFHAINKILDKKRIQNEINSIKLFWEITGFVLLLWARQFRKRERNWIEKAIRQSEVHRLDGTKCILKMKQDQKKPKSILNFLVKKHILNGKYNM